MEDTEIDLDICHRKVELRFAYPCLVCACLKYLVTVIVGTDSKRWPIISQWNTRWLDMISNNRGGSCMMRCCVRVSHIFTTYCVWYLGCPDSRRGWPKAIRAGIYSVSSNLLNNRNWYQTSRIKYAEIFIQGGFQIYSISSHCNDGSQ